MSNIQYQIQKWTKVSQITPKADNKFEQVLSHQHAYSKERITKQLLKKCLGVEFNHKKLLETTPTHLEQDTKIQTLIQMSNCRKDT